MKAKRDLQTIFCVLVLALTLVSPASAHPGKTDNNGGHTDHKTGEYHYHHGYPAHGHHDMDGDGDIDCPYAFDDKTDHSGSDNNKEHTSNPGLSTIIPTDSQTSKEEQRDIFSSLGIEEYRWLISPRYLSLAGLSAALLVVFYLLHQHDRTSGNSLLRKTLLVLMIAPACVLLPITITVGTAIMMATAIAYVAFFLVAIPFPKFGNKILSVLDHMTNRKKKK